MSVFMFRTLLFLTLFTIATAGAPTVVAAKAIAHPAWLNVHSDTVVGTADLVEIKGGKPAGLRPKFNNAAKPKLAAPRTKPPVASRQAVKPRSATGRALPSRVQGVKIPAQTRGIIKKPTVSAAARHQKAGITSNARGLAKSPLTPKRIDQTRADLRIRSLNQAPKSSQASHKSVMSYRKDFRKLPKNSLTFREYAKLRGIAQKFNTSIYVVGSRAAGNGRNIHSRYPVGKGKGTKSDIDIRVSGQADIKSRGRLSHALSNINRGAGQPRPLIGSKPTGQYIKIDP